MIHQVLRVIRLFPPFISRELREQYAGSLLGVVWSLLQPVLFILLYWWVFAAVMRIRFPEGTTLAETPFIAFLLSALLPWFAFQEGLNRAANAIVSRRDIVCKVHFPSLIFPLAAATAAFVVHIGSYCLFLAVFALWRGGLPLSTLGAVMALLSLQFITTAGLGLLLASFTVYLRDTTQVLGVLLMALFYTAPVLYPLTLAPEPYRGWMYLNPFTAFAEGYHDAILAGAWPKSMTLLGLALFAGIMLVLGLASFRRLEPGFADVL
ncbi:MAG: ABC transporter permease [Gammaproteobacteria bacterium]|nr:ABC transporter permease [Gammaproteobacteria bacterium]MCP5195261.1 ABC transporter permease [Gammaproteobacteria bacterium]